MLNPSPVHSLVKLQPHLLLVETITPEHVTVGEEMIIQQMFCKGNTCFVNLLLLYLYLIQSSSVRPPSWLTSASLTSASPLATTKPKKYVNPSSNIPGKEGLSLTMQMLPYCPSVFAMRSPTIKGSEIVIVVVIVAVIIIFIGQNVTVCLYAKFPI